MAQAFAQALYATGIAALFLAALVLRGDTPTSTVQAFVDALNARDAAAMARQGAAGLPFGVDFPKLTLSLGEAKVTGDAATLVVDLTATGASIRKPETTHETVALKNVGGDWRIVPVSPGSPAGDAPRPIAVLAMLATHPGVLVQAKVAAKKTIDLSHVKQVALAVIMYAADHDDRLPLAKNFKAAILPYLRDASLLTAPDAPTGAVSYFLDPRLSGMRTTAIARPAETAMVLEGTPAKTAFPWAGRTPMGYADGHAKMVDAPAVLRARTIGLK